MRAQASPYQDNELKNTFAERFRCDENWMTKEILNILLLLSVTRDARLAPNTNPAVRGGHGHYGTVQGARHELR
jgi:hypothetical protein